MNLPDSTPAPATPAAPAAPAAPVAPAVPSFAANPDAPFNPTTASTEDFAARYLTPEFLGTPATPAAGATGATGAPAASATPTTAGEQPRDAQGRFAKPDGSDETPSAEGTGPAADADATETDEAESTDDDPPPPPAAPAKPAPFVARDAEGELDVPTDLTLTFKVNGKDVTKPLADVVRLAQSGGRNEQLYAEHQAAQQEVARLTPVAERLQQVEAAFQQYQQQVDAQIAAVFSDPERVRAAFDRYQQANTPEARLQTMQAEIRQREQALAEQQVTQFVVSTVEREIVPRVEQIQQQYPDVTFEEIESRFAALTRPYMQGGRLRPDALPLVIAAVERDLAPWAEHRSQSRQEARTQVRATQDAAVRRAEATADQARKDAHRAKRTLARATVPTGRAAPDTPRIPPARTADEAKEQILGRVLHYVERAG